LIFKVTEKEIFNGVLNGPDVANNAIVFLREIENIETEEKIIKNDPRLASRFIELDENMNIDEDAKMHLHELKDFKIRKALPESNIHKMKVHWDPNHGISRETHKDYLDEFGKLFFDSVKQLIDRNALKTHFLDNFQLKDKLLLQEVLDHANFCNEIVDKFHGRNDLIEQVIITLIKI
jgi:hypothetical protein